MMLSLTNLLGLFVLLNIGVARQPSYPLLDQCHVMSLFAQDLATGLNKHTHSGDNVNCSLAFHSADNSHAEGSPTARADNCTQLQCHQIGDNGRSFSIKLLPCSSPPALRVTQDDSQGFVLNSTLSMSQTIAVQLDEPIFLFIGIVQHANHLTLGLEVLSVSTTKNETIVPRREIPLDKRSCPGYIAPKADTCRVMNNVTQYLNTFFSTVHGLEAIPECSLSTSCNDISCAMQQTHSEGYYNLSLLACQSPPALKLTTSGSNHFEHAFRRSEVISYSPNSGIFLNVSFELVDQFTVGFMVNYLNATKNNESMLVIPYVELLLNKSMCTSNSMHRTPLVTSCDIMPLISQSSVNTAVSLGQRTTLCSVNQNCDTSKCQMNSLANTTFVLSLFGCYQPPAIQLHFNDSRGPTIATKRTHKSTLVRGAINGNDFDFNVLVKQHNSQQSIGVQVTANRSNEFHTVIPYHVIPSSCSDHSVPSSTTTESDTCLVMSYVTQFITVFFANITNQLDLTPDCTVTPPSCHSIDCSSPDGSQYNIDLFPCTTPPTLQLEVQRSQGSVFRQTFVTNNRVSVQFDANTQIQVTMNNAVNMIELEVLVVYDNGTYSFNLPAIPYVQIPINNSECDSIQQTTHHPPVITSGPHPSDNRYHTVLMAVEIGIPSLLVFLFVVSCCLCLLGKYLHGCVSRKRGNYSLLKITSDVESDDSTDNEEDSNIY